MPIVPHQDGHGTDPMGRYFIEPLLPLDPTVLDHLTEAKLTEIKLQQLQYAAAVCQAAADAYVAIGTIIKAP